MTTAAVRNRLEALRGYAADKFAAIGDQAAADALNAVTITNDTRVDQAITWLDNREAQLWAAWDQTLEPFWQTAQDEVWQELVARFPTLDTAVRDVLGDADARARRLMKTLLRVTALRVQVWKAGR